MAGTDLPDIEQTFTADVGPYVAKMQEAIQWAKNFADAIQGDIDKITELQLALASLQNKDITVKVDVDVPKTIMEAVSIVQTGDSGVRGETAAIREETSALRDLTTEGLLEATAEAIRRAAVKEATDAVSAAAAGQKSLTDVTKESVDALGAEAEGATKVSGALWIKGDAAIKAAHAQKQLEDQAKLDMDALMSEAEAINRVVDEIDAGLINSLRELEQSYANTENAARDFDDEIDARLINSLRNLEQSYANVHNSARTFDDALAGMSTAISSLLIFIVRMGQGGGILRGLLAVQPIIDFISRWHYLMFAIGELSAVLIPAGIAFIAFAAAAYPAVTSIIDRMTAVYDVSHALHTAVYPLTNDFQNLAAAIRPDVYSIFGAALNAINSRMGGFADLVKGAGDALQQLAARASAAISSSGFSEFTRNAARDLQLLGTFIGNVFGIIGNVIRALPQLAAHALQALDGITHAFEVLTQSPVVQWITHVGLMFHGLFMYATTVVAVLGVIAYGAARLVIALIDLVRWLNTVRILMGVIALENPWLALAAGVIAISALLIVLLKLPDAAHQFLNAQESLISNAQTLGQVMNITANAVVTSYDRMKAAQTAYILQAAQVGQAGKNAGGGLLVEAHANAEAAAKAMEAQQAYQSWANVHRTFVDQMKLEQFRVMELSGTQGVGGLAMAMGILSAAGVKVSDIAQANHQNWLLDLQAVNDLIRGYQAMGQRAGVLGNDLNVITIQTGIQDTKVQALNSAWDSFLQLSTNLQSSFVSLEQGIQTMGSSAVTSSTRVGTLTDRVTNLSLKADTSLSGINKSSLALRSAFQQTLGNAETFFDALRTGAAAGAVSQKQLQTAVASTIAQILPFAKGSSYAVAQLSALAQEAGGPATSNFATLKQWVEANAVEGDKFNGMIDRLTGKLTNVTTVAKQFATTMQNDVITALAQGAAPTQTLTQDSENLRNELAKYPPQSQQVQSAAKALDQELFHLGFTVTEVKQLNSEMGAGAVFSGKELQQLQRQAQATEGQLGRWPRTEHTSISMSGDGSFTIHQALSDVIAHVGRTQRAMGGLVTGPGTATSDSIPARLSSGEYVVQAASVAHYGKRMLDSINQRRFAEGGLVDIAQTGNITVESAPEFGQEVINTFNQTMQNSMVSQMRNAIANAKKQAQAMLSFGVSGHGGVFNVMSAIARSLGWGQYIGDWWNVIMRESGGSLTAQNPTSGAYGIAQFIDGPSEYYTYGGNPNTVLGQLTAMANYIRQRYGTPAAAWASEINRGWYDQGGFLMPGMNIAFNGTGQPEQVLPPGGGGPTIAEVHSHVYLDGKEIWSAVQQQNLKYNIRNSGAQQSGVMAPTFGKTIFRRS